MRQLKNTQMNLRYPMNLLSSYPYYRNYDMQCLTDRGARLIFDSGAFSALTLGVTISVSEYADWLERWSGCYVWAASLDVIGDETKSFNNYLYLRNRGLDVVPTVHFGSPPSSLDSYISDGVDFIGLGGLVGVHGSASMRWCLSMFRHTANEHQGVRFHGWGATRKSLSNLPWFSVDSTSSISVYRYGSLSLFDPQTHQNKTIKMNDRDIFAHRQVLQTYYGINDIDSISVSNTSTRRRLIRLSAASVQYRETFLRSKYVAQSPSYAVTDKLNGPHIHIAEATNNMLYYLKGDSE